MTCLRKSGKRNIMLLSGVSSKLDCQPYHTASKRQCDWLEMLGWKYLLKFWSQTTAIPVFIFYLYRVGEVFLIFGLPSETSGT